LVLRLAHHEPDDAKPDGRMSSRDFGRTADAHECGNVLDSASVRTLALHGVWAASDFGEAVQEAELACGEHSLAEDIH
jgi:hypothetical protein